jgi:hypothetical protein
MMSDAAWLIGSIHWGSCAANARETMQSADQTGYPETEADDVAGTDRVSPEGERNSGARAAFREEQNGGGCAG